MNLVLLCSLRPLRPCGLLLFSPSHAAQQRSTASTAVLAIEKIRAAAPSGSAQPWLWRRQPGPMHATSRIGSGAPDVCNAARIVYR